MKTTTTNYTTLPNNDSRCCQMVEKIFALLNQGSLYDIYKMLDEMRNKGELSEVKDAFAEKYDFNFLNYI